MFSQNQSEIKLEWMYKGAQSTVDREEYLLGKSVDKSLEQQNAQEKQQKLGVQQPKNHVEHECIPPSIRDYKQQMGEQVDINTKLQEDPLIAIKKQEEEKRRQFLNNPIQIKKLQKALKMQKSMKKNKRKQVKSDSDEELDKKLAKKLKSLRSSDVFESKSSSKISKDNVLDTILMHKYNQLKSQLSQSDITDILEGKKEKSSTDCSTSEDDYDSSTGKSKNRIKGDKKYEDNSSRYTHKYKEHKHKQYEQNSSSEDESKKSKKKVYKSNKKHTFQKKLCRDSSDSDNYKDRRNRNKKHQSPAYHTFRKNQTSGEYENYNKKKERYNKKYETESDSDSDSRKKNWGLVKADGTKIPLSKHTTNPNLGRSKLNVQQDSKAVNFKKREKLTETEKEKRRQEMIKNALLRDKERAKNLKTYRDTTSKEELQKDYKPDFLKKELLKSANSSSVESRIKANMNNIQRSGNDMSKHFSRR